MERAVYDACKLAIGRKEYGQLTNLLASYQKALGRITEAESKAQMLRVQSGELIHRDTVRNILARWQIRSGTL